MRPDDAIEPPRPGGVSVGGLSQARSHKRRFDAVMTLEDPMARGPHRLRFTAHAKPPHLVLAFEDADSERFGYAVATRSQVERALAFGREHATGSLLIHCMHGVGRSAGCALAILADRAGPGREAEAVAELFRIRAAASPNLVVVAHADHVLGRGGALGDALAAHEEREPDRLRHRRARDDFARDNGHLYARAVVGPARSLARGPDEEGTPRPAGVRAERDGR